MSQFAAGCAVCGADLEAARRARAGKRGLPRPRLPGVPPDLVTFLAMALTTLFVPLLGVLLTVFVVRRQNATSQRVLRVGLYLVVAVGVVLLALPATRLAGIQVFLYG